MKSILSILISLLTLSCSSPKPPEKDKPDVPPPKKIVATTPAEEQKPAEDWQTQIQQYDSEIRKKTNQMNLHLAKASRAQDQGDRLQFQQGNLLDARRYWQIADYNREQAKLLEKEIELLKLKKAQLLQEHGSK